MSAKHEAFPYQLDAYRAVQDLPYAAIFHEPGLGKTKMAIDIALYWLTEDLVDTVIVVTKKTLVLNWRDELTAHCHVTPRVLSEDRRSNSIALNSPVLIYLTHYEAIRSNFELIAFFLRTCRAGAILDESHKIKNPEAKLSVCFHRLAPSFCRRIILTGTPVANRPHDIWSQIKFLDGGAALGASYSDFRALVDLPSRPKSRADYGRSIGSIADKISVFSVRETKRTAGIVLPEKTIVTHEVEITGDQLEVYNAYRDEMRYEFLAGTTSVIDDAEYVMKRLLRLVQCASNPALVDPSFKTVPAKAVRLLTLLEEIQIHTTKAVIWTTFVDNVEFLCDALFAYKPQKIHGRIAVLKRHQAIAQFNSDPLCRVLIATPASAKEGLTLTVANHAIFYDRGFGLDDYLQAQDRIHRISQKHDCYVHNFIAKRTVDEWVDTLLNAKYLAARVAQGDSPPESMPTDFTDDILTVLNDVLTQRSSVSEKRILEVGG